MLFQNLTQYIESFKMLLISSPFSLCLYSPFCCLLLFFRVENYWKYVRWKKLLPHPPLEKQIIKQDAFSKTFYSYKNDAFCILSSIFIGCIYSREKATVMHCNTMFTVPKGAAYFCLPWRHDSLSARLDDKMNEINILVTCNYNI